MNHAIADDFGINFLFPPSSFSFPACGLFSLFTTQRVASELQYYSEESGMKNWTGDLFRIWCAMRGIFLFVFVICLDSWPVRMKEKGPFASHAGAVTNCTGEMEESWTNIFLKNK